MNTSKIKHEFAKLKKSLAMLFYGIEAIFILFLALVIFLGVYGAYNEKKSIINYLPDNLTGLIYYTPSKGGDVFNSLFLNEAKKYFQSDEIFFDNFKEAAIIFLENKGTSYPLLIFTPKNAENFELLKNNGKLINEVWNEKFIVMAEEPKILKLLSQGAFKYKRTLKLFKEKNGFNTVVYLNLEKIKKTSNSLDKAILNALKTKKLNELFIGLKECGKDNCISIADISGEVILSAKIATSSASSPDLIFLSSANLSNNASQIFPAETFSEPNNAIAEILPAGKIKIIILKNFRQNDGQDSPEMPASHFGGSPEMFQKYVHNQLMLNGEKSPLHYIIAIENNENNEKILENLKISAINYLDKIMPEEKTIKLPDGTFMTELWSNPERLKFKESPIACPASCGEGCWGVLSAEKYCILGKLTEPAINFAFTYAKTPDCILLSNSTDALSDYLLPSEKSLLNCDNTMPLPVETGHCPVSTMKNDDENENFYINIDYLKSKSDIFKILSEFGNYATGVIKE